MKKLIIILALGFISNSFFSQTIKINVTEVVDIYNADSINTSLNNHNISTIIRDVNSSYEIDLTQKQFRFYKNNILKYEGDIKFTASGNIYTIHFLIDDFNSGIIINMDIQNEQVTWFSSFNDYEEISKFTKFEIIKSF